MATQRQHRRGTTSEVNAMTPAAGEVVIDTTLNQLCVGNGSTAGGIKTPTKNNPSFTGLVDLSDSTAGQIKFPTTQNASSDANTLDDYEEGTFTPTITFGGGSTGITYSVQVGEYTKIGNRVFFSAAITLSNKGSSAGQALINGLPFTAAAAGSQNMPPAVRGDSFAATINSLQGQITNGATTVLIVSFAAGVSASLQDTSFTNSSVIRVSGHYKI